MRILIVEDDDDFLSTLRDVCAHSGHDCGGVASSVEEAVAVAALAPPDVVIFDIQLRGEMIGIEGAQLLRRSYPTISVIFVSGYSDPMVVQAASLVRHVAYLVKPVTSDQVIAALAQSEAEQRALPPSSRRGGSI